MTLSNGASAETTVELRRGVVARVALAPQLGGSSRVWPWVTTGTSLALLATGAVLVINSEARRSELEDAAAQREPGTALPANDYAELESIDSERTTFQYVGIGLLAGGGAVVRWVSNGLTPGHLAHQALARLGVDSHHRGYQARPFTARNDDRFAALHDSHH